MGKTHDDKTWKSSGAVDLVTAAKCAALHNRCRQIREEYSDKLKYSQNNKNSPDARSLPKILNSHASCQDQVRKEKCTESESFYVAIMNTSRKEDKGNYR